MSTRVYSEINLHITWHTKGNLPLIQKSIESKLFEFLNEQINDTRETRFHAIGGTENHMHLAVSIPPNLEISNWVGKLKGSSSFFVNKKVAGKKILQWQRGFGIVSFGTKDLDWIVDYVQNQKMHHSKGRVFGRLEIPDC